MKRIFLSVLLSIWASLAAAVEVDFCYDHSADSVTNISLDRSQHRSFANGAIKVWILDQGEPACCSFFVAVVYPSNEPFLNCEVISLVNQIGWGGAEIAEKAQYSPTTGLTVTVLTQRYGPELDANGLPLNTPGKLTMTINQQTATMDVKYRDLPN